MSSSVDRTSRGPTIGTIDKSNEAAFWASYRGTASQTAVPPTIGTSTTERSERPRRYGEDDDRAEDMPRNGNVSFDRRNYRQEKQLSARRPDPATMAPHSSGALLPPAGRRAETRVGASYEADGAQNWWREGGSRTPSVQRAGFLGDKEKYGFGSAGRGTEWDLYPDASYGDEDDEQESAGRFSESPGVYKSARSKRRMSRGKRARAAKGPSLGDRRRPAAGLDGGWARYDSTAGRASGFS